MTETPAPAYDAETTPNGLADEVGMDHLPTGVPIAPYSHGETLVDAESGEVRHVPVPVNDDGTQTGTSVGIQSDHPKPWLDVLGHGEPQDEETQ